MRDSNLFFTRLFGLQKCVKGALKNFLGTCQTWLAVKIEPFRREFQKLPGKKANQIGPGMGKSSIQYFLIFYP